MGVLSRGECLLDGFDRPGQSGDILLGPAPDADAPNGLPPVGCAADRPLHGRLPITVGCGPLADGAACPGAAELIAQLHGIHTAAMAYALPAPWSADETARPLSPLVAEAVAAIRQNYMALYGVEELSEQLGVTKSHLVRVFKQEIGIPPGKYMTDECAHRGREGAAAQR